MKSIKTYIYESYKRFYIDELLERSLSKKIGKGILPNGIKIIKNSEVYKKSKYGSPNDYSPIGIAHIIKYIQSNGNKLWDNAATAGDASYIRNQFGNLIEGPKLKEVSFNYENQAFTDKGEEASLETGNYFGRLPYDMTLNFDGQKINIKYDIINVRRGEDFITIKGEKDTYSITDFIIYINEKLKNK